MVIYAVVEQGNVADAEANTAEHHYKVVNRYWERPRDVGGGHYHSGRSPRE